MCLWINNKCPINLLSVLYKISFNLHTNCTNEEIPETKDISKVIEIEYGESGQSVL